MFEIRVQFHGEGSLVEKETALQEVMRALDNDDVDYVDLYYK